jgi:hypothetical protein
MWCQWLDEIMIYALPYFPVRKCNQAVLQPGGMPQKIQLIRAHLESMSGL